MDSNILKSTIDSFGMYGIIIDSGTNINFLPDYLIDGIASTVNHYCNKNSANCQISQKIIPYDYVYNILDAPSFFNNLPPL
jgi:hypothetical protein